MKQQNKIKIAMVTNHFGITGISSVILNYCKALDHNLFEVSILAGEPISEVNRALCNDYGVTLIALPSRHGDSVHHYFQLWKHLRNGKFDIVHVHGSSSMMAIELTLARMAGCKKRIAHSHNSKCPNMKIHKLLNPYFRTIYTKALSCGKLAGDWLFGECKFDIIPNGFETERFRFQADKRIAIRTKLKIENKKVIGHIGRFNEQKNQPFLLKAFEKVAEEQEDYVLLLVGTGPDFEKIKQLVAQHPYKDRIILYGETADTVSLYSAMDVFVLPSLYEGLPVVLLEAQINGLPCMVSDSVTKEVDFGEIVWESLQNSPKCWADHILSAEIRTAEDRSHYYDDHKRKIQAYDIRNSVKQLEAVYRDM